MKATPLLAGLAICLGWTCLAQAEHPEWATVARAFKDAFVVEGLEDDAVRSKARARKRTAVIELRTCADARAVPALLGAHKKQLKFIEALEASWAKRQAAWERDGPIMRKVLGAKQQAAGPGKPIPVTPAEQAWMNEQGALTTLRMEISREEELAETLREAMATVASALEGKEQERALADLLAAAGQGGEPQEREFIRALGRIPGAAVTRALTAYAESFDPFVAQAGLEALGRHHDPASIDFLLSRLHDPRWQLRVAAVEGLAYFREARVVEALLARFGEEDGVLRRHYAAALARMFGLSLPVTPEAWTAHWKEHHEEILKAWAAGETPGPVQEETEPVAVGGADEGGSTSFYGLRTVSKHILFVIDVSGSMGEIGGKDEQGQLRIDVAKRELSSAIRTLSAEDGDARGAASFNVVAYDANVYVFKQGKMLEATKRNKEKAFEWIGKLEADGATNISDALEQAFGIIGTRKAAKQFERGADTIFLMTDGKPTAGRLMDPDLIRGWVKKINRERQITIHTIGVGGDHDAQFLQKLAAENGGNYLAR